jgi:RHS repeat-associated protein
MERLISAGFVLALIFLFSIPTTQAAPADCMSDSPDGKAVCTDPVISDYAYGYCIPNLQTSTANAESYCAQSNAPFTSEGNLISQINCVGERLTEKSDWLDAIHWGSAGSSLSSYWCGNYEIFHKYGQEMVGFDRQDLYYSVFFSRRKSATCPRGYTSVGGTSGFPDYCKKEVAQSCQTVGNPLDIATGEKQVFEVDYPAQGASPLEFRRSYSNFGYYRPRSSGDVANKGFGDFWRHNYDRRIFVESSDYLLATANRPNGKQKHFRSDGTEVLNSDGGKDRLTRLFEQGVFSGWKYDSGNGDAEIYSTSGQLMSIHSRMGQTQTLTYSDAATPETVAPYPGLLIRVTDDFGRLLNFTYDAAGRMKTLTDPAGEEYAYTFNSDEMLTQVQMPDGTARRYTYNEPYPSGTAGGPYSISGIYDENGDRYATYRYRDAYWSTPDTTEHGAGVEKYARYPLSATAIDVIDPQGSRRSYTLQNIGGVMRIVSQSQPAGSGCNASSAAIGYDALGNVRSETDFNGVRTCHEYTQGRNLEAVRVEGLRNTTCPADLASYAPVQADQRKTSTEWHADLPLKVRQAGPGKITTWVYNGSPDPNAEGAIAHCSSAASFDGVPAPLLCKVVEQPTSDATGAAGFLALPDGNAREWHYSYNGVGQLTAVTDPRGNTTNLSYYTDGVAGVSAGDRAGVVNALGHTIRYTKYNLRGQLEEFVDPNGITTALTYSRRGWMVASTVKDPAGDAVTLYEYDNAGQIIRTTLPDATMLNFEYDSAHRLIAVSNALGERIDYTLDNSGHRIKQEIKSAGGNLERTWSRTYDALSRLHREMGAGLQQTTYGYDAGGNPRTVTDPHNQTTNQSFDALNRLVQVTDPLNGVVGYGYNTQDRLVSVTDALGHTTTYTYDGLGNLLSQQSPDTGTTTYTHDAAGNVLSQLDAKGQTTRYSYDALNRLTQITYADGRQVTYTYDSCAYGIGRLCSLSDAAGTTAWDYDSRGRVSAKHQTLDGLTLTTAYRYTAAGQLAQMTYPSGLTVDYQYSQGQLTALSINGQPFIAGLTYQAFGPVTGWAWSSGRTHSRSYDLDGQLTAQSLGEGSRHLSYDLLGNLTALIDPQTNLTLSYDALSRLTAANDPQYPQSWTYDRNGNRLSQDAGGTLTNYVIDPAGNRLTQVNTTPYQYDANGNLIHDGTHSYGYDSKNRLVSVDGGSTAGYTHNALGQRVRKSAGQQSSGPDYSALAQQAEQQALTARAQAAQLQQQADAVQAGLPSLKRAVRATTREATQASRAAARLTARATRASERAQDIREHADALAQQAEAYRAQLIENPTSRWQRLQNRLYQRLADFFQRWSDKRAAQAQARQDKADALSQQAQAKTDEATLLQQQADSLTQQVQDTQQETQQLRAEADTHLQQATQLEQQAAEYRQLAAQGGGTTTVVVTVFMYDEQGQLIGEYDESGTAKQETVWLGNLPVATYQNGQTYAVHADHLGTPRAITNSSYTEVWRWDSDPFGTTQANEDPDGDGTTLTYNLRFPGQYFDQETGLHYNYFRDYDPSTGRYIESDPIGLNGGLNTYTYVSGNPVNAVDPFGLDETTIRVPAPPFVFPKGSPGYDATLNALNALSDAMHSAVDAVKQMCSSNEDEEKKKKNCQAVKDSILNTCAGLTGKKQFKCWAAANTAYRQCMGYE